jgi:hypothetical protein
MEKENNKDQPLETEISFENLSNMDDNNPSEFIEPLKENEDPVDGEEEIDLDSIMDDEGQIDTENEDQAPSEDTVPETDELSGRDATGDALETSDGLCPAEEDQTPAEAALDATVENPVEGSHEDQKEDYPDNTQNAEPEPVAARSDPETEADDNDEAEPVEGSPEPHPQIIESEENDSAETGSAAADASNENDQEIGPDAPDDNTEAEEKSAAQGAVAAVSKKKKGNPKKLALAAIFICGLIIVLLVFSDPFSFFGKDTPRQTVVPSVEPDQAQAVGPEPEPEPIDAYTPYRTKLREAVALRESILMKRREIQGLKDHYRKGIEKLENDILVEVLDCNLKDYEKAIKNKRVELRLQTIQRRQAYIDKLDDPMEWLEQGSEELLYLKRKAAFDLQLITIAGGIDMKMHMRHINAAIQKYQLTADNLAITPDATQMQPLGKIWSRLYLKTENNPALRTELTNWYIQQEICSGDLSRIGELSQISIETARCMSQIETSDLFLNNIAELSPSVTRYLCQWDGKWLCLNGVTALSPTVANYLFQWNGEWISLNGVSEFTPELAEHLMQWQGKQLELMGLDETNKLPDKATLTYFVQWENGGGKLFVPPNIRNLMNQL